MDIYRDQGKIASERTKGCFSISAAGFDSWNINYFNMLPFGVSAHDEESGTRSPDLGFVCAELSARQMRTARE
jgi:hypothetical protein